MFLDFIDMNCELFRHNNCAECEFYVRFAPRKNAGLAQLVEQLICNQQVAGSSPIASSKKPRKQFVFEVFCFSSLTLLILFYLLLFYKTIAIECSSFLNH